jgi:uncharacterized Zn finger protein (UPF0148 family)
MSWGVWLALLPAFLVVAFVLYAILFVRLVPLHSLLARPWRIRGTIVSSRAKTSEYSTLPMDCVLAPGWAAGGIANQLVALTCPRCGAPLPPAVATQAVVCSYCKTPVVHEIAPSGPKQGEVFETHPLTIEVQPELNGEQAPRNMLSLSVAAWVLPEFSVGRLVTLFVAQRGKRLVWAVEMLDFVDERTARTGEATVVSCSPGAKWDAQASRWLELGLSLDEAGSRRMLKGFFPQSLLTWFAPGSRLPILIGSGESGSTVAVDWSKALGGVVGAGGKVLVAQAGEFKPARVAAFPRAGTQKLFCVLEGRPGEWIELERLRLPDRSPLSAPNPVR